MAPRFFFACISSGGISLAKSALDLPNWMGQLEPVIGDATLLDLSLPGAHDAMTYDLSDTISDGYEGMGEALSSVLHRVTPIIAGKFVRQQGQTQGMNITAMLDGGIRFVDFRIMRTAKPDTFFYSKKDWYNLHGCQSKEPALHYLQQAREWLVAHPKEVVVFWASRHGNTEATGTDQYPNTSPKQRQGFFHAVQETFGDIMFDASQGMLNETRITDIWARGQQVIWYASDYEESTDSSSLALDGRMIDNQCPNVGARHPLGGLSTFRSAAATLANDKAANRFFLMSMATSGPTEQIEHAALLTYMPLAFQKANRRACAQSFNIPGMDDWCPMSLQDVAQLNNYYGQMTLEQAFLEGGSDESVDFPNAIYIDGVDEGGRIRTGHELINPSPRASKIEPATGDYKAASYAYSATVIGATYRRLCRRGGVDVSDVCAEALQWTEDERALHPLQRWSDATHGRLDDFPAVAAEDRFVV